MKSCQKNSHLAHNLIAPVSSRGALTSPRYFGLEDKIYAIHRQNNEKERKERDTHARIYVQLQQTPSINNDTTQ